MADRAGTFIVIEGTDGSGKGTQFELLCERLRQAGYDVANFDFPQYGLPSSYFVKQYLNGEYGSANDVGPYTASLFYALDRYEAAPKIKAALEQGKVVVSNRFTGSSMGHQGTKFRSPEERRGFFIWLDNLEFEMLRIPRPDISFVLRVPADVAQTLIDKKAKREYTDKKRDIHEADFKHLEKSVEVYDDLTQLFPKDFQRIDCVRSGKLLAVDAIQNMLWEKITPLLPPPPQLEMPMKDEPSPDGSGSAADAPAASSTTDADAKEGDEGTEAQPAPDLRLVLDNASNLLAQRLEQSWLAGYQEQPWELLRYDQKDYEGNYKYYVPAELNALTTQQYHAHMDEIFDLYTAMLQKLTVFIAQSSPVPKDQRDDAWKYAVQTQAYDALLPVLPAAAKAAIAIPAHGRALDDLIIRLLTDELPEARMAGELLLGELHEKAPQLLDPVAFAERTSAIITYRATTYATMKKLAREYLPDNHAAQAAPVQLVDVWPRNEMDLVPDMLYQHSSLPLAQLRETVAAWPYNRKLDIFEAYIGNRTSRRERPGAALKVAHYTWDLVSDYGAFRELQRHRMVATITWQALTPRDGYDMPQLLEDAGLADQFEQCFDISLKLYSLLQNAGYEREAQYATLLGHKMRWTLHHTAREACRLYELPVRPAARRLLEQMREKQAEVHPLLAESIRFADVAATPAAKPNAAHLAA